MSIEIPTFLAVLVEKLKSDSDNDQMKLTYEDGKYVLKFREDIWSIEGDDRSGDFYQRYKITIVKDGEIEYKPYERYTPLKSICECNNCEDEDENTGKI